MRALGRFEQKNRVLPPYPELLQKAAETARYADVVLSGYVNIINNDNPNQFSALVFTYGKGRRYIAFRGTDDNLAGWKEDFLMGFKDVVPAQSQAVKYVGAVVPRLRGRVILGGHSKGGNLAVFSAIHTSDAVRRRIDAVYNNDGPGFQSSICDNENYKDICRRIHSFIPKSSVVGMLLEHGDDYTVVASREKGICRTTRLPGRFWARGSCANRAFAVQPPGDEALRSWLNTLTLEQREQFVEALFDIIQASARRRSATCRRSGWPSSTR
jgi:hypothetical protein